ncbi:MAG TPA: proton-conducting transporter membrane subunit [Oculatellaceae cyanobacterium]
MGGFLISLLIKRVTGIASISFLLCGILFCLSGFCCWSKTVELVVPTWLRMGWLPLDLHCDTLSSFFIILLGLICIACALFSSAYVPHLSGRINLRAYWGCLFLFLLGMFLLLLAGNAITFLMGWELMSLSSFVLVGSEYQKKKTQNSAFIYLVATRTATMFLMAGFLLMSKQFLDITFTSWSFSEPASWLPAALIMLGLIIKSGVWPFYIWLPYAHPEAPSPVSALMSGIMVKLPVYAAIRFFVFGHLTCTWLPFVLLLLSAITAFWGVLFALNQYELKRLLAYSTVENIGLLFIAVSAILLSENAHLHNIAQMALIAVLLHTAFHALFKSLLFLCAGSVDFSAHTRDITKLGGLGKTMPITFVTFVIGSAAICALPPLNGFASKWCIYQALLQCSFGLPNIFTRAVCLLLIGLLGAVGALAVASFVKAIAITFMGKPRSAQVSTAKEVPLSMRCSQAALAVSCLVTGAFAPKIVTLLEPISVQSGLGQIDNQVFKSVPLASLGCIFLGLTTFIYFSAFRKKPKSFTTWDCGFGAASIRSQVSAGSFGQPIARIFTPVLQYHLTLDISGQDRRHFPEKIIVEPSIVSLMETKLYLPIALLIQRFSQLLAKLQAGSIHLYLSYVCVALIILLVFGVRL